MLKLRGQLKNLQPLLLVLIQGTCCKVAEECSSWVSRLSHLLHTSRSQVHVMITHGHPDSYEENEAYRDYLIFLILALRKIVGAHQNCLIAAYNLLEQK